MEFVCNASEGFRTAEGVRAFTRDQIGAFLDTFAPLFELGKYRSRALRTEACGEPCAA